MAILDEINKKVQLIVKKKTVNALEGAYQSIIHSRSLDIEDLKEYSPGDNAKDIAWKATAHSPHLLVKRFMGDKQFPVLFVADTGKSMKALTTVTETRQEILEGTIGVLGKTIINHHDMVGLLMGDEEQVKRIPFKSGQTHLEFILHTVREHLNNNPGVSSPEKLLEAVIRRRIPRSIIIIVSKDLQPSNKLKQIISTLNNKHEVLWISIGDMNPLTFQTDNIIEDVETNIIIPEYVKSRKNQKAYEQLQLEQTNTFVSTLKTYRVSYTKITGFNQIVPNLTHMLQARGRKEYA